MDSDDPLSAVIETIVRSEPSIERVEVNKDA